MRAVTETSFEVRVSGVKRGASKLFDTYPTMARAKRVGLRLAEAGIAAAVVKVIRRIVWHHASSVPAKAKRNAVRGDLRSNAEELGGGLSASSPRQAAAKPPVATPPVKPAKAKRTKMLKAAPPADSEAADVEAGLRIFGSIRQ